MSMKVFINPAVAALPQHAHLFAEDGCLGKALPQEEWTGTGKRRFEPRRCGTGKTGIMETPMKESMLPLEIDPKMHENWIQAIRAGISLPKEEGDGGDSSNNTPPNKNEVVEAAAGAQAAVTSAA